MPPPSSSKSQSQSRSQSQSQSQSQGRRQSSYHDARSTSFGEVQDPMLWMTRTPVQATAMDGRPPFLFASRQMSRTPSPYPANVPAARGYLPSYQLPGAPHHGTRSPPIPLYRRFPTPKFTSNTGSVPPLRSEQTRPYSATAYRTQQVSSKDGEDEVVLPPRPATTSDTDRVVPPRSAVFPARRKARENSKAQGNIKNEMASQASQVEATTDVLTQPFQQPNSQKQPRIILKNYKRASKPLDGIQESAVAQASKMGPKASPFHPLKQDTTQTLETKQEEKLEYGEDDSTVTGSSSSSCSDDELALDSARDPPSTSKPHASSTAATASMEEQGDSAHPSTARKGPTPWNNIHETSKIQKAHDQRHKCASTAAAAADDEDKKPTPQKRPPCADASTQASATWLVSRTTQTAFEAETLCPSPKRQKNKEEEKEKEATSSAGTIASVMEQANSVLRSAVISSTTTTTTPRPSVSALVVAAQDDVGALVRDQLRAGDAGVLAGLELAMLVRMAVDDEDLYAQVERMLA
ncbi:hypothetical protein F4775DRAFT_589848 [Biscogniauxia sp. FL1348]|nr:hypothetical protein F4775DRAFT_589848 [Biscogniauxia sp. FL1348]